MTLPNQDFQFNQNCSGVFSEEGTLNSTETYRAWLILKKYSPTTIRNYLSDLNAYLIFINKIKLTNNKTTPFSPDSLSDYIQTISADNSYRRYISSLSKFFQYAIDQNFIKTNPLRQALKTKKPKTNEVLGSYQTYLVKKKFSTSTIRNYINDIQQFINFCQSNSIEPK